MGEFDAWATADGGFSASAAGWAAPLPEFPEAAASAAHVRALTRRLERVTAARRATTLDLPAADADGFAAGREYSGKESLLGDTDLSERGAALTSLDEVADEEVGTSVRSHRLTFANDDAGVQLLRPGLDDARTGSAASRRTHGVGPQRGGCARACAGMWSLLQVAWQATWRALPR